MPATLKIVLIGAVITVGVVFLLGTIFAGAISRIAQEEESSIERDEPF